MGLDHPAQPDSGRLDQNLPVQRPTVINMPKARADALQRVVVALQRAQGYLVSREDQFALLELSTQLRYAKRNPRDPSEILSVPVDLILRFGEHVQDYADPDAVDGNFSLSRREVEGMQDFMSTIIKEYGPCDHSVGICYCDLQRTYDRLSDILNRPSAEPSLTVQLPSADDIYDNIVGQRPNLEEEELK